MILGDVLHVLRDESAAFCHSNPTLYVLLFTEASLDDLPFYENKGKKAFSKTGLPGELHDSLCDEANFNKFCEKIEKRYLSKAYNHERLYQSLRELVKHCIFLPESHRETLLSSCNPSSRFQLARFIAACILLGSYHSSLNESDTYTFNIDFMNLNADELKYPLSHKIWEAEQQAFLISRQEGNRFSGLDIIDRLLPQGYVTDSNFQLNARGTNGEIRPLMDICKESIHQDIAVTGEGGIGKTTFLQQLLQEEYLDGNAPASYKSGRPIPIFIELRQCPKHIQNWYQEEHKKTNFITRYIGTLLENHNSLEEVSTEKLVEIEKEMQRIPQDGNPKYLLLLDGFNEISVSCKGDAYSCRAMLSNEIATIHKEYPNVRIIATSRETQAAYFTSSFQNVYLVGLNEDEIREHLKHRKFSDTDINMTLANRELVKCLKVPLFLCMFSYEHDLKKGYLPETRGEILYYFFHGNSTFYNARKRAADTKTNTLDELQTALTLDFILPYIGWTMERNDTFSLSERELKSCIGNAFDILKTTFAVSYTIPFEDFEYDFEKFSNACSSLVNMDNPVANVIGCSFDYLGILYQYLAPEKELAERRQYSFIHHYFRDYFSAIFDVQLLRMLPHIEADAFIDNVSGTKEHTYHYFLNSFYWNQSKSELISQILMEHRNKPVLNPTTMNWQIPKAETDEQKILTHAIDFCKTLKSKFPTHHLLRNALSTIVYGRHELSGMDLSNLDFSHCNIFSIPCSKKGMNKTLTAKFDNSILPDNFLEPDDHLSSIEEYAYSGQHCYTLDMTGTIKCWDILSGCVEYILHSGDPNGITDFSPNGYMKISADGHWLAAKVYNTEHIVGQPTSCLYVFNLHQPENAPLIMKTPKEHNNITSFSFTHDCNHILYLADVRELYCFRIENESICYSCHMDSLYKHSELYTENEKSDIYIFSGEYDNFDSADFYSDNEDEDVLYEDDEKDNDSIYDSDDGWDTSYIPIPCMLGRFNPNTGTTEILYNFSSVPGTYPVTKYFPTQNCFLLFNEESGQLERFSCDTNTSEIVYEELTAAHGGSIPATIQYCPERPDECYIIYPKHSYSINLSSHTGDNILMEYNVSALNSFINDDDEMEDLIFYPDIIPSWNRFIIRNSETTYEWDTINDTLKHRYNTKLYGCCDLIYDRTHQLGLIVHQFNGISIFGNEPMKLVNSLCYPNPEYYASGCSYHEETMMLAIMFFKASHEYVEIINLKTGEREIVYSTKFSHETLENVHFHPNGNNLLITLGHTCLEYDCLTKQPTTVVEAGENELFIDGFYTEGPNPQIQIAVVEHFNYDEPHIEPHCDFYSIHQLKSGTSYKREWRYYMPTLTEETAKNFMYASQDIGSGASYTKEEFQTYWCTCGFFLHEYPSDEAFRNIRCTTFRGGREVNLDKSFGTLQMIYCRHDFALANRYRTEKNRINYTYCSDDLSEVIELFNHSKVTYWKNLKDTPTADKFVYDNGENTSDELSYVTWFNVVPWNEDTLLSCYEEYRLMQIKKAGCGISKEIPYAPSIAIIGCTFKNVVASQELIDNIKNNGGIII